MYPLKGSCVPQIGNRCSSCMTRCSWKIEGLNIGTTMDKWTKFIPRTLFTSKDGSPICAFLDMHDKNAARNLIEMFETRGGAIVHKSPSPFTINFTDRPRKHSRYTTAYRKYPVFNVNWIIDCIDSVELVDINPYLINKYMFEGRNFMEVIFEKLETSEGSFLVENLDESSEDDWKMVDRKKPPGKYSRRRGPPKNVDYVQLQVDRLSEDDFYCELATSAVTKAVENILLNERTLTSKTKDQLKKHDPDVENRIFKHQHKVNDTSWMLLNDGSLCSLQRESSKSSHKARVDGLHQSQPTFSASGEQENDCRTPNHTFSYTPSDECLVRPLNSITVLEGGGQIGSDSTKQSPNFPNGKKLQRCTNILLLSSRVLNSSPQNPDKA